MVSPIGLLVVSQNMCLNCGHEDHENDHPCPSCGFRLSDVITKQEQNKSDKKLLTLARDALAKGTCRRGLTIINYVLARRFSPIAFDIKIQFLEHLGFNESIARMINRRNG